MAKKSKSYTLTELRRIERQVKSLEDNSISDYITLLRLPGRVTHAIQDRATNYDFRKYRSLLRSLESDLIYRPDKPMWQVYNEVKSDLMNALKELIALYAEGSART